MDEDDICFDSNNVLIEVHDSVATPIGMSYVDVEITVPASSVMDDDVALDPLNTTHASPLCSLPPPPPDCHNVPFIDFHDMLQGDVSDCMDYLGTFRGYDPSIEPYSLYLESMPLKIMFVIAFTSFTGFSMAFDKA